MASVDLNAGFSTSHLAVPLDVDHNRVAADAAFSSFRVIAEAALRQFGVKAEDWGFTTFEELVTYCVDKWGGKAEEIFLQQVPVMEMTAQLQRLMEPDFMVQNQRFANVRKKIAKALSGREGIEPVHIPLDQNEPISFSGVPAERIWERLRTLRQNIQETDTGKWLVDQKILDSIYAPDDKKTV